MPPQLLYDINLLDFSRPLYDIEAIRRINPQRNQMEQLSAVLHVDRDKHLVIGYKDLTHEEFWVSGHMPGFPLMPGVIMCEVAAQLASFYCVKYRMLGGDFVGFGGMEEVVFRGPIFPGCRFLMIAQVRELRINRRASFEFQGIVDGKMMVHGTLSGVPIHRDQTRHHQPDPGPVAE